MCPYLQDVLNGEVLDMARRLGASGMKLLVIDTGAADSIGTAWLGHAGRTGASSKQQQARQLGTCWWPAWPCYIAFLCKAPLMGKMRCRRQAAACLSPASGPLHGQLECLTCTALLLFNSLAPCRIPVHQPRLC